MRPADDYDDVLPAEGHSHPLRHDPLLVGVGLMALMALAGVAVLAVVLIGRADVRDGAICAIIAEQSPRVQADPGIVRARHAYGCPKPSPSASAARTAVAPSPTSTGTASARSSSVAVGGPKGLDQPGLAHTPTATVTARPTPSTTRSPHPSMSPTTPALLCVLTICLGGS